jgi:hypothetical protein
LSEADATLFRKELERMDRAGPLKLARAMASRPEGRFPTAHKRDVVSTLLPTHSAGRHAALLLEVDALVRIQDGDGPGAAADCLALANVARAYTGEPLAPAQLIRTLIFRDALRCLERLQAQNECREADLAELQRVLTAAAEAPVLVTIARGERGAHHYLLGSLAGGDVSVAHVLKMMGVEGPSEVPGAREIRRFHAWLLRHHTEFVAIAGRPANDWPPLLKALDEKLATAPLAGTPLCEALTRDPFADPKSARKSLGSAHAAAVTRHLAELRCGATALAVERYRLEHRAWPRDLAALAPAYLKEAPKDPYDGRPLRYRRTGDGVVVYSVGPDLADNEGKLDRSGQLGDGVDVGFQLWDADKRPGAKQ